MVGAARGRAAWAGEDHHGLIRPSAVQGKPGAESENSQPFLLTARQVECLDLAAAGCTEREAALRLGIAVSTVRGHLARARARLGARSTCQAVVLALKAGLLEDRRG
jgi:DNA-binding CsgD family transcriptional regulator